MKRFRLEYAIICILLVIMGLIVVHAPLTVFIGSRWPNLADGVKAWKELLLLAALVLLVVEVTRRRAWQRFTNDTLLWAMLAYAALHGVIALVGGGDIMAIIAGLMIDLRYVAYFAAVYMCIQLYPQYQKLFLQVALAGAVVVIGFAALQLVLPKDFLRHIGYSDSTIKPYLTVDENPAFIRHSSTLRGPNPLGAYAVMVLAGAVALGLAAGKKVTDRRLRYLHPALAVGAVIALWSSQSRSAWIAAGIATLILLALRYWGKVSRKGALVVAGTLVLAAITVYSIRDTNFFHNVVLHDNPTTGANVDSNTGHMDSLLHGFGSMLANPLGNGVGSTGSASLYGDSPLIVENQYLFIAHEAGWLGLALFMYIFCAIMARLWGRRGDWRARALFASGVGLSVIGLLLPVWVDDTVAMVWWGLTAAILAVEGGADGKSTNKKAKRTA